MAERRYLRPGTADRLFNALVAGLARLGVSIYGSRILEVKGRRSGLLRAIPVNLLEQDGVRYLVAPRGDTEWVRNLRAAGRGGLRLGARVEPFVAHEIADSQKLPVLRTYVTRWWFEVKRFFELSGPDASDAELARIASQHPVFRVDSPAEPT